MMRFGHGMLVFCSVKYTRNFSFHLLPVICGYAGEAVRVMDSVFNLI